MKSNILEDWDLSTQREIPESRIGCVIYSEGEFYQYLADFAYRSFRAWHPNIRVFTNNGVKFFTGGSLHMGTKKYLFARHIFETQDIDKLIILGADTITCNKLSFFTTLNNVKVIASLNYKFPYHLSVPGKDDMRNLFFPHLNADCVCFNDMDTLDEVIDRIPNHPEYVEQGALNEVCASLKYGSEFLIAGWPEFNSPVAYNIQAKGNASDRQWHRYMQGYYVKDGNLYTCENKIIALFHYCEAFSMREGRPILDYYFNECFNDETLRFLREKCDYGDFIDAF